MYFIIYLEVNIYKMGLVQILKDNNMLKKKNMFSMGFMRQAVLSKFPVVTENYYEQQQAHLLKLFAKLEEDEKNREKLVEVRTEIQKNQDALEIVKYKRALFKSVCNFKSNQVYNYAVQ